jgi:hypothetical protein
MKNYKFRIIALLCTGAVFLSGCMAVAMPELDASQQRMYAKYAAGTLMKYNLGSNMRVLDGLEFTLAEEEQEQKEEQEAARQQAKENYEEKKAESSSGSSSGGSSVSGNSASASAAEENYIDDIGSFLGLDQISIVYQGYYAADSYPEASDDMFFAMDATAGKKLIVVSFAVTNTGADTKNLDMLSRSLRFRLTIGDKTVASQSTLLLDDLSAYQGDIAGGATENLVLIFEVSEEQAASTDSMELIVRTTDDKGVLQIQ